MYWSRSTIACCLTRLRNSLCFPSESWKGHNIYASTDTTVNIFNMFLPDVFIPNSETDLCKKYLIGYTRSITLHLCLSHRQQLLYGVIWLQGESFLQCFTKNQHTYYNNPTYGTTITVKILKPEAEDFFAHLNCTLVSNPHSLMSLLIKTLSKWDSSRVCPW